ncbi:MAG: DUF4974 domain-containing protein [Roseivirga sp.]|nr:DUF4974 domain-containing protein [Roseivirga sp.]
MTLTGITEEELWAYITKTAGAETIRKTELWLASPDFNQETYHKLVRVYELMQHTEAESDVAAAKTAFFERVEELPTRRRGFLKYAAVLALILSSYFTINWMLSGYETPLVTFETAFGERDTVNLPDGSVVFLNAASSLSYPESNPRSLYLEGEAFFEVFKDKSKPFTVDTREGITVKALGTSFNVRSYDGEDLVETFLLTGKVEVDGLKGLKEKVYLVPNEQVKYFSLSQTYEKFQNINPNDVLAWREGKLRFTGKQFREVAADLKIRFGISLNFDTEEMAVTRFTGTFDEETPLIEILETLRLSKSFEYEQQGKNTWLIK